MRPFTANFSEIRMGDVAWVGGKNASLGEMFSALKPKGVGVFDGFAITTDGYWRLLEEMACAPTRNSLFRISILKTWNNSLRRATRRAANYATPLPAEIRTAIAFAYSALVTRIGREAEVAVRSSASAEDLPEASFAGAAETFLERARRRGFFAPYTNVLLRSSLIAPSATARSQGFPI